MGYLNIPENQYIVADVESISDTVEKAIKKVKFHPSILLIKNKIGEQIS